MNNLIPKLRFSEFNHEFKLFSLSEITAKKISYGIVQAGPFVEGGMPYIKSKDLNSEITLEQLERTSEEIAKKYSRSEVTPGDIVFSLRGNIGVSQILPDSISVANLTQGTARISLQEGYNPKYLINELQTYRVKNRIAALAKGSTFQEMSLEELRKVQVALPVTDEQQKIADFLSSVDKKIALLKEKHDLLVQYKKGVMQRLFSQEIRFKDEAGKNFPDWEPKVVGDFMVESRIKGNNGLTAKKITVKLWGKGVFGKSEKISGSENTQYYQRKSGQFIYSKLDFLNCAFGLIPERLDGYETTVDLPCFDVADGINKYLILEFIKQKRFYKKYGDMADGSRKAKRIHAKDFLSFPINLPCESEQNKIADFLQAMDKKLNLVSQQIEYTQTFKKGLLQQMFV